MKNFLLALTICFVASNVGATNYDSFISELYDRNQRLMNDISSNQLPEALRRSMESEINDNHAFPIGPDAEDEEDEESDWGDRDDLIQKEEEIRNAEIPSQNNLWGEHRVSGGTGKGSQSYLGDGITSKPEVKTNNLPAYCDPPNPCPIGMNPESATSPCDQHVEDTKRFNQEWIKNKMKNGECPCDTEHMQHCESSYNRMKTGGRSNNPYFSGNKRAALAAKKSPTMWTDERKNVETLQHSNPFLQGQAHAVKKKNGRFDRPYM